MWQEGQREQSLETKVGLVQVTWMQLFSWERGADVPTCGGAQVRCDPGCTGRHLGHTAPDLQWLEPLAKTGGSWRAQDGQGPPFHVPGERWVSGQ